MNNSVLRSVRIVSDVPVLRSDPGTLYNRDFESPFQG
jgi:hypothetical protein